MKRALGTCAGIAITGLFIALPALSHPTDSGCTPRNHPTPVPSSATTVEQTGTQVWQTSDGTTYVHGSTGWLSVNPGSGKAQFNPSGERFNGTPADNSPAEEAFDNTSLRVEPNGSTKICLEVAGEKVEQ